MQVDRCHGCGYVRWVNVATRNGVCMGEYCAECFDLIDHDKVDRPWAKPATIDRDGASPWQENAIRDLEEAPGVEWE